MNYPMFLSITACLTILLIAGFGLILLIAGFGLCETDHWNQKRKIFYSGVTLIIFQICFSCYAVEYISASSGAEKYREELTKGFAKKDLEIRREVFTSIAPELPIGGPYEVIANNGKGIIVVEKNGGDIEFHSIPTSLKNNPMGPGTKIEYDPFKNEWVVTKSEK